VVRENLREREYSDAKCFDARRQDVGAERLTAQKPAPEKDCGKSQVLV
jgi:hypothetical protein